MLVVIHSITIARNNPKNMAHKESNKIKAALAEVSSIYRKRLINSKQSLIIYRLENNQCSADGPKLVKIFRILGFLIPNPLISTFEKIP